MTILFRGKRSKLIVIFVVISFPFCKTCNSLIPESAFVSIKEKKEIQFEDSGFSSNILIYNINNINTNVLE